MLHPQTHRNLSEFSTFGIGGPVRYFTEVRSMEEAREAFAFATEKHVPTLVLGKGSNCLFSDRGFDGLAILNKIDFCTIDDREVHAGAGMSFSLLGVQTARRGLAGLEFASGIPATVGGAIFMNAGANGKETCEPLVSVSFLLDTGEIIEMPRNELSFSYRASSFQSMRGCILSARFHLTPMPTAREQQLRIIETRMKTQPLKEKSAGCVFRNPSKERPAGALIDQCGLKGVAVGDAMISPIHANFIVNRGKAKQSDVLELIRIVQAAVKEKTGIQLEPEIKIYV